MRIILLLLYTLGFTCDVGKSNQIDSPYDFESNEIIPLLLPIEISDADSKNPLEPMPIMLRTSAFSSSTGKSSSSKPSSYKSSSSSYSPYKSYSRSSYKYSQSSYRPMSSNIFLFVFLYNIAYIEMHFIDISDSQYCPLKNCIFINETTINTPLRRNISVSEMIRVTNHTKNATTFNTIISKKFGCSIDFNECLASDSSRSLSTIGVLGISLVTLFFYFSILCIG